MNEVFLIGRIITEVEFKFIINSKREKSIAKFTIKTEKNQEIFIRAYNEQADFVYSRLKHGDNLWIYGKLNENDVIVKGVKKL